MPSPIAHLAAGAVVATMFTRNVGDPSQRRCVRWCIWPTTLFFSLAPDMDAIPGFITGNMTFYHNQISHSLVFGIALCLFATGVFGKIFARFLDWWSYPCIASVALISYGLHLAMDAAAQGPGVKLLWPITVERFTSPVIIFYGVRHSEGLFAPHHLITVANELAIIAGFLLLVRFFARQRRRASGSVSVETRPIVGTCPASRNPG